MQNVELSWWLLVIYIPGTSALNYKLCKKRDSIQPCQERSQPYHVRSHMSHKECITSPIGYLNGLHVNDIYHGNLHIYSRIRVLLEQKQVVGVLLGRSSQGQYMTGWYVHTDLLHVSRTLKDQRMNKWLHRFRVE